MSENNVDSSVLLPILKQIPLFASLNESLHMEIINHIVLMYYPKDYVIFKEGDEGDALYIVKNGKVDIKQSEEGNEAKKVAEINTGGFFGEMALVSSDPRNAAAITTEESEVFILSKGDFQKLLDSNAALAQQVSATVVARMKQNNA